MMGQYLVSIRLILKQCRVLKMKVDAICTDCHGEYEVPARYAKRTKYCPDCRVIKKKEQLKIRDAKKTAKKKKRRQEIARYVFLSRTTKRHPYEIVSDPGPEPYSPGAAFSREEIDRMLFLRNLNPGTRLKHRVTKEETLVSFHDGKLGLKKVWR